jgi:putative ABC transport system permease protein
MGIRHLLAWFQLIRGKNRFLTAIVGIAFSNLLMFMQFGFKLTIHYSQAALHRHLEADIALVSAKTVSLMAMSSFPIHQLYRCLSIEGVESVNPLYVSTYPVIEAPDTGRSRLMLVIGYNPENQALDLTELENYNDRLKQPNVFLLDRFSRGDFVDEMKRKLSQGDIIETEANDRRIDIIGLFSLGSMPVSDGTLITSDLNFIRLFTDQSLDDINVGLVNVEAGESPEIVKIKLQSLLTENVRVFTKEEYIEFEKSYIIKSSDIGKNFNIGVLMGAIISAVIMYQVLYAEISDHLPEYAILKARGYSDVYLSLIICQQALMLSLIAYLPSYLMALAFYDVASRIIQAAVFMTFSSALQVLILSTSTCCVSALISLRKMYKTDLMDIFY